MDVTELLTLASEKHNNVSISTKISMINGFFYKTYELYYGKDLMCKSSKLSELKARIRRYKVFENLANDASEDEEEWYDWMN